MYNINDMIIDREELHAQTTHFKHTYIELGCMY